MQPSPAMQALIEQIYHIFRRYPVPQKFVVCCEYCLSQQEQKVLRSTSLRAGNDSNLLIVFYVQIMPDDFVMQLHRF